MALRHSYEVIENDKIAIKILWKIVLTNGLQQIVARIMTYFLVRKKIVFFQFFNYTCSASEGASVVCDTLD